MDEEKQLLIVNKNQKLHHLNPRLTKIQASKLNLNKMLSQFHSEFIKENDFRECSLFLSELALIYLKQHKYLRVDIESLKKSLIQENQKVDEIDKTKKKSKVKADKKQKNNESDFRIEEKTFTFNDQPRNLLSADKIQLQNQQRTSVDVEQMLKRENQQNKDSSYRIELVVKDLSQIQKQSLSEVLNKKATRQKQLVIPQTFANFQVEDAQEYFEPHFKIDEEDEQEMNFDEKDEILQQEIKLSSQKLFPEMSLIQQDSKKNKPQRRKNKIQKNAVIDDKIQVETDFEYKKNIESFLRISQKVDDLKLKMNLLKLEPEFWAQEDALFGLIDQISIQQIDDEQLNAQTSPIRAKINEQSNNISFQNKDFEINEFNYQENDATPQKNSQMQRELSYYQMIIQTIQQKLPDQSTIYDQQGMQQY